MTRSGGRPPAPTKATVVAAGAIVDRVIASVVAAVVAVAATVATVLVGSGVASAVPGDTSPGLPIGGAARGVHAPLEDQPVATAVAGESADPSASPPSGASASSSGGDVVVAYPDEPAAWLAAFHHDAGASDLAALWGLPLYAYDQAGQLRPRLALSADVMATAAGEWAVEVALRPGRWSDQTEVTAADVVATVDAVRGASAWAGANLDVVTGVEAVSGDRVRFTFDEPTGRWPHVLAELGTILPAAVLATDGVEAYRDGLPVTGGPFRLAQAEPGLLRRFVAHADGPLGVPGLSSVEVVTVPSFETALGLLDRDEVDVVLGHLALEPIARVEGRIEGVHANAPHGATMINWKWDRPQAPVGESRVDVHAALRLDAFAEGLLGSYGHVVEELVAGSDVAWPDLADHALENLAEVVLATPRSHEAVAFAGRSARDAIERRGGTVRVVSDEGDNLHRQGIGDAQVVVRRFGPWPSLTALFGVDVSDPDVDDSVSLAAIARTSLAAADRADLVDDAAAEVGLRTLLERAAEIPLVTMAVTHVWRDDVTGISPSAWPGVGFWSVQDWRQTGT